MNAEVKALGEMIIKDLNLIDNYDVLNRWMITYIAEQMHRYETAVTMEDKQAAGDKCTDAIMKFWKHRHYNSRWNPLEKYTELLQALYEMIYYENGFETIDSMNSMAVGEDDLKDQIKTIRKVTGWLIEDLLMKNFVRGSGIMDKTDMLYYLEGLICSIVGITLFRVNNSTLSCQVENIIQFPIIYKAERKDEIDCIVRTNNEISKVEWNSFEISWDFRIHPLRSHKLGNIVSQLLSDKYKEWETECKKRFASLKANEEEINRIFINIYGLQDELTPEVEDKEITIRLADKERDIKSLISYLVGIVMGRYSLDVEGLAYAGGEWDASKYRSYQPDDDGIVAVYSKLGMEESLIAKIIELIKLIYGEDTYRQNIDFIAEALGKNNNESSEETLNRYLNESFYVDHLKVYQKRPIYWMFSSGKNSGFKCLIYMHRYNEDTLARINGMYFLPESTRLKNEMEELNRRIEHSEGRERISLEKERTKLAAKYDEAIEYGQVLDHMANKYIPIDLDDGVKVNYEKFQGVELVSDSGTKVKKDLLVPIK